MCVSTKKCLFSAGGQNRGFLCFLLKIISEFIGDYLLILVQHI